LGAVSRTWRSRSSAVSPTSVATFCAPAPGTETTISLLPCGTTVALASPVASTRLVMICTALVIAAALGAGLVFCPGCFGVIACNVMDVPLDRSSPRPT
jgi:hypothetical protein